MSTITENEKGLRYLHELLAAVEAEFRESDEQPDDLDNFKFVLRTLLLVVGSPYHPREQLSVQMAAVIAPRLLEDLFEDERAAFAGDVDLNHPKNLQQSIASMLAHAVRIFGQRCREYRRSEAATRLAIVRHEAGAA